MMVSIHQPNFFPWLGYFQKIARSRVFVVLDEVLIQKTGSTWVNRCRLLVGGEPRWVTCPIRREHGTQPINQVRIDDVHPWRRRLMRSLETSYGKADHFETVMSWLEPMIFRPVELLCQYNLLNLRETAARLGLECRFVLQSELPDPGVREKQGSWRLAAICHEVGANTYVCGDGAGGYEDPSAYRELGIELVRNDFRPVAYAQVGTSGFVAGLSVLDALLNLGPERTAELLQMDAAV